MSTNIEKKVIKINTGLSDAPVLAFKYEDGMAEKSITDILGKVADQYRRINDSPKERAVRALIKNDKVTFSQSGRAISAENTFGKDLAFSLQPTKDGGTALVASIDANNSAQAGA